MILSEFLFPLRKRPSDDYYTAPRSFGALRRGGRKHAGCDLYSAIGDEVLAMADGTIVLGPYEFYKGTYAIEIKHTNGMVVRYSEISSKLPRGLRQGSKVTKGQVIGYVGQLPGLPSMLHLEMYKGTGSGLLTERSRQPFQRRSDLVDPTPYLDGATLS